MSQVIVEENKVSIVGPLTRLQVDTLRAVLLEAMTAVSLPCEVALDGVDEVDSAGVQLLASLILAFPEARIGSLSEPLEKALQRLGARSHFGGRQ